jgi:D-alanyl-D-alanine carboxypeptidase
MRRRECLYLLTGAGLGFRAAYGAEETKPVKCTAAVAYRGGALHAAPPADVWTIPDGKLEGAPDPLLALRLSDAVDWILDKAKAPGITAAVGIPGKGLWSVSRGLLTTTPETPLPFACYFHWASAGKAVTAAVVQQLAAEQKLSLTAPLARWFPDFPNAKVITLDHLLTHTGGVFNFNSTPEWRTRKGYQSPEEIIRYAAKQGSPFCPGERWHYSNTGYVLLGRIIEQVEQRPLHEVIRRRVLEPLGLKQTVALAPRQKLVGLAVGHTADGKPDDFEPTTPFGAGNLAGSARDMVLFWHALLTGKLVLQATVRRSFDRLYPMYDPTTFYGRGVMLFDLPEQNGHKGLWLGHAGGTEGLNSVIAYDAASQVFATVAINGKPSAAASVNKLLAEVRAYRAAQ